MSDDLPTVSNSVEDTSGQVVQVGAVYGDINLHQSANRNPLPLRAGLIPLRAASFQERANLITDRVTVLFGMGGVGKTQLAADHAERRWEAGDVELLVWVTASSREAIVSAYADAATKLTGQPGSARTLLEWLATTTAPWLVVLDDLRTPADLAQLWPPSSSNGQVVVTTRRRDSALRGHRRTLVEVDVFDELEALTYLRTVLADQPRLLDDAEGLVQDLGHLPVALAQAAAYMVDKHLCCSEYRTRFAARRLAHVVPDDDGLPDEHQATVAATWSLSVELADRLAPAGLAGPLLDIASVLDPNGIPVAVFTARATLEVLSKAARRRVDAADARDGLGCLHRLSLITVDFSATSREVRVHPLVQRATLDAWPDERTGPLARTAATALGQVWPEVERDTVLSQVLRSNVDALAAIGQEELWRPDCHIVLLLAGHSRSEAGLLAEARDYYDSLLEIAGRLLGPDHQDTMILRNNRAIAQSGAGDLRGAAAALEELLADYLRLRGPDHPRTLATRNNLAYLLKAVGDRAGAVAAYEDVLADRLRVLGPHHPDTLLSRNNLVLTQAEADDHETVIAAYQDVLADHLRVLGPDHPDTLLARMNLARRLGDSGEIAEELAALRQLRVDALRALGPDHPNTFMIRNNLAMSLADSGDHDAAVSAIREVLADRLRVLGPEHPETMITRRNLAQIQAKGGDHEAAITSYQTVLADRLRVLGPDHPDTLRTRSGLGYVQAKTGDLRGALATFEQLLTDNLRVFGPDHSEFQTTRRVRDLLRNRLGDVEA